MKVKDLKASEYNPRKITDSQLEMLKKSMEHFGDLSGIVFNKHTGNIVGGHQRIKNLLPDLNIVKEKHKDNVGTVAIGYIETDSGRISYREVDWDLSKEKAANIAANKHGGEFDFPMLADLLQELDTGELDMDLTGFTSEELEQLMTWVPESLDWSESIGDLPDGDKSPFRQITFTLHDEQFDILQEALSASKSNNDFSCELNENSNGNALYFIAKKYLMVINNEC